MDQRLINIGFGNSVLAGRVIAIVHPKSSPMKKLRDEARDQKKIIDVTEGRRTRSIIITDSNHVILSSIPSVAAKVFLRAESMSSFHSAYL